MSKPSKSTSVTFPKEIIEAVRKLIDDLKYWPSLEAFVREACLENLRMCQT